MTLSQHSPQPEPNQLIKYFLSSLYPPCIPMQKTNTPMSTRPRQHWSSSKQINLKLKKTTNLCLLSHCRQQTMPPENNYKRKPWKPLPFEGGRARTQRLIRWKRHFFPNRVRRRERRETPLAICNQLKKPPDRETALCCVL